MLKLMYITKNPKIALIAEKAGVDRIFLDMEYIGKAKRQCGMDTVLCSHTIEDIKNVRSVITESQLLVRCNSLYEKSRQEINDIVSAGADVIMLPYFHTADEVKRFVDYVDGRATVCILLETPGAVDQIDEILSVDGVEEVHIGINDLSIGYGKKFLFEVLADGTVDYICNKCKDRGLPYGFGGIASLGRGLLSSEYVIMEHYRVGSTMAILSRSFCNSEKIHDLEAIKAVFQNGIKAIRQYEDYCKNNPGKWEQNRIDTARIIETISRDMT